MKIKLRGGVSLAEQISFYRQLAVILRSGLPLLNALQLLQKHGSAKQMLFCYRLQQRLRRGSSLAQALATEADCCTQLAVTLVAVGEESGELATLLEQLADYYSRQLKLRRFVQRAVTYPAFLLLASFGVLLLFLLYILPVLADTYSAMGVLPAGTLALLLTLKDALLQQPLAALALTAGVAAALFCWDAGCCAVFTQPVKRKFSWPFIRSTLLQIAGLAFGKRCRHNKSGGDCDGYHG